MAGPQRARSSAASREAETLVATSTIDTVKKLMELALHNPNEAEAASAAMMAVRLIDKFSLPVGDNIIHRSDKEWVAPPSEFYDTVADIFTGHVGKNPDADPYTNGAQVPGGLMAPDNDLDTKQGAFAAQIVRAWRAIREARKALAGEFYRWEQRNGRRFVCDDCGKKPL